MSTASATQRDMRSTASQQLQALIGGHRRTALVYVAAQLGLADLLSDGPRTSDDLAQGVGAHAPSLHRLLRGLVLLGVLAEGEDGRFGLTPLGEALMPRALLPRDAELSRRGAYGALYTIRGPLHGPNDKDVTDRQRVDHRAWNGPLDNRVSCG